MKNKTDKKLIILYFFVGLFSLGYSQTTNKISCVDIQKEPIKDKKILVTTPIIYKAFIQKKTNRSINTLTNKKVNKTQDNSEKDVYIRFENRDYFVKFCSSKVTRAKIEAVISEQMKQGKTPPALVTLCISITKGSWDICQHNSMLIQSRIGNYAIVHRIVH